MQESSLTELAKGFHHRSRRSFRFSRWRSFAGEQMGFSFASSVWFSAKHKERQYSSWDHRLGTSGFFFYGVFSRRSAPEQRSVFLRGLTVVIEVLPVYVSSLIRSRNTSVGFMSERFPDARQNAWNRLFIFSLYLLVFLDIWSFKGITLTEKKTLVYTIPVAQT